MKSSRFPAFLRFCIGFFGILLVFVLARLWTQPVREWLYLRSYVPPAAVAQLAGDTTMTEKGQRLFYLNKPAVLGRQDFNQRCPASAEKTIVLGCYHAVQQGIYIFAVKDKELRGVEQVTAAHEMLHAAYDHMSSKQRKEINALLLNYYEHNLRDTRIHDVLESYKKTEPNDLVNEMHSIFGTEITTLPEELETYYQQYFVNRAKVTGFANQYRKAFTEREAKIETYDRQLTALEQQINDNHELLQQQAGALAADRPSVEASNDQTSIDEYNQRVAGYNALLAQTNTLIDRYNDIVAARNAIALEEKQLQQQLNSSVSPE